MSSTGTADRGYARRMHRRLRLAALLASLGGGCALVAGLDDDDFVAPGGTAPVADGGGGPPGFSFEASAGDVWHSEEPLTVKVHLARQGAPGAVDVALVQPPEGVGSAGVSLGEADDGSFEVKSQGRRAQGPLTLVFAATPANGPPQTTSITVHVAGAPGELDTSFAQIGFALLPGLGSLHAVTIAPDGAIVAFGDDITAGRRDAYAARLLPSGDIDFGFRFPSPLVPEGDAGEHSALRSAVSFGDRIIFGGSSIRAIDGRYAGVLGALFSDGGLDPGFGERGGFTLIVRAADDDGGVRTIEDVGHFVDAGPRDGGTPRFATAGDSDGTGVVRLFGERGNRPEPTLSGFAGSLFTIQQIDSARFLVGGNTILGQIAAATCAIAEPCSPVMLPSLRGSLFGSARREGGFVALGTLQSGDQPTGAIVTRFDANASFVDAVQLGSLLVARKAVVLADGLIAVAGSSRTGLAFALLPKDGDATGAGAPIELPLARIQPVRARGAWEAIARYRDDRTVVVGETSDTVFVTDYLGTRVVARYWN